jgi:hypothetical protein
MFTLDNLASLENVGAFEKVCVAAVILKASRIESHLNSTLSHAKDALMFLLKGMIKTALPFVGKAVATGDPDMALSYIKLSIEAREVDGNDNTNDRYLRDLEHLNSNLTQNRIKDWYLRAAVNGDLVARGFIYRAIETDWYATNILKKRTKEESKEKEVTCDSNSCPNHNCCFGEVRIALTISMASNIKSNWMMEVYTKNALLHLSRGKIKIALPFIKKAVMLGDPEMALTYMQLNTEDNNNKDLPWNVLPNIHQKCDWYLRAAATGDPTAKQFIYIAMEAIWVFNDIIHSHVTK